MVSVVTTEYLNTRGEVHTMFTGAVQEQMIGSLIPPVIALRWHLDTAVGTRLSGTGVERGQTSIVY